MAIDPRLCGVVLHYCSLAPSSTTADEYRRGKEWRSQNTELKKLVKKTSELQAALKYVSETCDAQYSEMKALISQMEKKNLPKEYMVNRKSGKTQRIRTGSVDVGADTIAYCGYIYGKSNVRLLGNIDGTPPHQICRTCLREALG